MEQYQIVTLAERPELYDTFQAVQKEAWPTFVLHDAAAYQYWPRLFVHYPHFQLALEDRNTGEIAAIGHCTPVHWQENIRDLPDTGWDWALSSGSQLIDNNNEITHLCALSIIVRTAYQGQRLSQYMINEMKRLGKQHGFDQIIIPVRPSFKRLYPLTKMTNYLTWTTDEGLPFDPWVRTHVRLGAKIVKICPRSMSVVGSVAQWQTWTGLHLPESGLYVVEGGLTLLKIDIAADRGIYVEPNVWMQHTIE